jgi:glutaredoxin 3
VKPVTIYTTQTCPYCARAKALLAERHIPYAEIDVTDDDDARERLVEKSDGRRTVPQIFIGETHVGGCDDLMALDSRGGLMPLLNGS